MKSMNKTKKPLKRLFNSKVLFIALACSLALASCSDDDNDDITPIVPVTPTTNFTMNISGLENLGSGYAYEGWVITSNGPISTGTFTVNDNGTASATSFWVNPADLAAATKYVLTIEPSPDADPTPSDQKLLAGDFQTDGSALVSTGTMPALGDFSNASGTYFLRTPTDETMGNNMNDENGIWFGNPTTTPLSTGFVLPTLPTGWVYEGWIVAAGIPISTGRFTDFEDRDGSNMFSGTADMAGPPIPGEDFFNNSPSMSITFPLNLRGKTTVISVEPEPDNSPLPFLLKPLISMIDTAAATAPAIHNFNQNLSSIPTGTVTR
jgi:hypothetical protein